MRLDEAVRALIRVGLHWVAAYVTPETLADYGRQGGPSAPDRDDRYGPVGGTARSRACPRARRSQRCRVRRRSRDADFGTSMFLTRESHSTWSPCRATRRCSCTATPARERRRPSRCCTASASPRLTSTTTSANYRRADQRRRRVPEDCHDTRSELRSRRFRRIKRTERFSMYALKVYMLPRLYWHGMLRGRA